MLSARQQQANIVIASVQLQVLGVQLQSVTLLWPSVAPLITQLQALSASDPAVSALVAELQQVTGGVPTVGSLIERIALLNRLLADVSRKDPGAAMRIAALLPELHLLLLNLHRSEGVAWPTGADGFASPLSQPLMVFSFAGDSPVLMAPSLGAVSYYDTSAASSSLSQNLRSAQMASGPSHGPWKASQLISPGVTGPSGDDSSTSVLLQSTHLAVAASGGTGPGGAPALALLAVLTLSLLSRWIPGRMSLNIATWSSALIAGRLERPG